MAKITRGKFRWLRNTYMALAARYPIFITGKHRNLYPSVEVYSDPREYDFNPYVRAHTANRGYYEGCKRIHNEIDTEVFVHITEIGPNAKTHVIDRTKQREAPGEVHLLG